MYDIKRTVSALVITTVEVATVYAWKFTGSEGAGNVVTWWACFLAIGGLLVAFSKPKKARPPVLPGVKPLIYVVDGLVAFVLVWFGSPWIAAAWIFGELCLAVYAGNFNQDGSVKAEGK